MGSLRKPLFMSTEGYQEEMDPTDTVALGGAALSGNLTMGSNSITGLNTNQPADGTSATSKSYVDGLVVTGGKLMEGLLEEGQISDAQGIMAAEVLYFANQPAVADTVVFKNAALTRTYTFVADIAGEATATDVSIESSAATAMARLVTRMNADAGNTEWVGIWRATGAERINAAGVIVVRENASAAGNSTSRIYGVFATPADAQVVAYAAGSPGVPLVDYQAKTGANMPAVDPAAGRFGLRRQASALLDGEMHLFLDQNSIYLWDDDANHWNPMSGGASVPDATSGSGGAVKGKITVDSDFGLVVNSGVLKINLATDPGLQMVAGGGVSKLKVLPDTNNAIDVTAAGVKVKVDGTTITVSGGNLVAGLVGQAKCVENDINCSAAVALGAPVYVDAANTVAPSDTTDPSAFVVGVALLAQPTIGSPVKVISEGIAAGVLTGLVPAAAAGDRIFLKTGGGLVANTLPAATKRVVRVGIALNANDLLVQLVDMGKKA